MISNSRLLLRTTRPIGFWLGKNSRTKRSLHDGHRLRALPIPGIERAARQDGNAHRLEEPRADIVDPRLRLAAVACSHPARRGCVTTRRRPADSPDRLADSTPGIAATASLRPLEDRAPGAAGVLSRAADRW